MDLDFELRILIFSESVPNETGFLLCDIFSLFFLVYSVVIFLLTKQKGNQATCLFFCFSGEFYGSFFRLFCTETLF